MKVYFDALGCPKALVDAERMCFFLEKENHILVPDPKEADAIIINTCGFIEQSKTENIDAILQYVELKKQKPGLRIVISGCLPERYRKELMDALPEIDSSVGVRDLRKITDALTQNSKEPLDHGNYSDSEFEAERKLVFSGLHYAYLKLAEGCSRGCAFCSIPGIRGTHRSRPMASILKEASFLEESGIRELILVSEDTLYYGQDLYNRRALIELLQELAGMDFTWIRVLYLYPEKEIYPITKLIAQTKNIVNYLDIPFQHASHSILKAMKRPGNADDYLKMLDKIRTANPEIRIRSSFIVGFPGETPEDQKILTDFIRRAELDRVGFFEYSREEGTTAYDLKKRVSSSTAQKRIMEAAAIQEEISVRRLKTLIGKTLNCIHDGVVEERDGIFYRVLRTEYDAPDIDGTVLVPVTPENADMELESAFDSVLIKEISGNHDLTGEFTTTKEEKYGI